jgi:hypothetical protein
MVGEDRETKEYPCDVCGEIFSTPLELGRHKHAEHPKKSGRGVGGVIASKAPTLTEDQVKELQNLEYEAKKTELEIRKAKALYELQKYESHSEPPKEKTWVLPDGTSFQGSSADYRDMLQTYYQTQAIMKKSTSTEENPTVIKAMLERMAELEKSVSENKLKGLEDKLNYIVNRDPVSEAETGYRKLAQVANDLGFSKGSDLASKKFALQESAVTTTLKQIDKKLDLNAARVDRLVENFSPIARRIVTGSLDKLSVEHPEYHISPSPPAEQQPIDDENLKKLSVALTPDSDLNEELAPFNVRGYLKDRLSPHSKHKTKTLNS